MKVTAGCVLEGKSVAILYARVPCCAAACLRVQCSRCEGCAEEGSCLQVNGEIVSIQRVCTPAGEQQLKKLIEDHVDLTGSSKAAAILKDWSASLQKFWQLVPPSGAAHL